MSTKNVEQKIDALMGIMGLEDDEGAFTDSECIREQLQKLPVRTVHLLYKDVLAALVNQFHPDSIKDVEQLEQVQIATTLINAADKDGYSWGWHEIRGRIERYDKIAQSISPSPAFLKAISKIGLMERPQFAAQGSRTPER